MFNRNKLILFKILLVIRNWILDIVTFATYTLTGHITLSTAFAQIPPEGIINYHVTY